MSEVEIHSHGHTKPYIKEDEITEDLTVCDSSEANLKNFCGKKTCSKCMEDASLKNIPDNVINIQRISALRRKR